MKDDIIALEKLEHIHSTRLEHTANRPRVLTDATPSQAVVDALGGPVIRWFVLVKQVVDIGPGLL
jgi:hypothetical protein